VALAVVLTVSVELVSNLPFARRFAAREITHVLDPILEGKIIIENIGSLHLGNVGGIDVRIQAPDGTTVITARGVRGRIAPIAVVTSLLRHGELRLDVFDCDAESIDVNLDTDDSGALKLASAFQPAHPSAPPPPGAPPGRAIHLEFPHVATHHSHAHGQMKGAPPIDTDLDGLLASVSVLPGGVTVDVAHVELTARGMPQGANPHGTIQGRLAVPSGEGEVIEANASFAGTVGGIPTTAQGTLRGDRLDASVDVPEVAAEKIRALSPQVPMYQPAAAHAEGHGQLSSLGVTARASVGGGRIDMRGTVTLMGRLGGAVALDVRKMDLRAFVPAAPRSSVDFHTDVHADTRADGLLSGAFSLDVPEGGSLAGQSIPAATFRGNFDQKPGDAVFVVETTGNVSEPGAPIALSAHARTGEPAPVVDFVASSQIDRLADVRRAGGLGPGSANVRVAGVVTVSEEPSFDATVDADVVGLAHGPVHVERARLEARAFGPLSSPTLKAAVDISRGATDVHASVDRIREEAGRLDVEGISITGLGEPVHGALHVRPQEVAVQAESKGLALKSLGYLFGIEDDLRRGRLAFSADFSGRRSGAQGTVKLDMTDVCIGHVDGLSGNIDVSMDGRKIAGSIDAAAEGVGTLKVAKLDLEVGGRGPLEWASWRRTWGTLDVDGQADLRKLVALLPPNSLPFAIVAGQLALKGHAERDAESDVTPDLSVALKTSNLVLSPQQAPDEKGDPTLTHPGRWQMVGVDVQVDAAVNGKTGATTVDTHLVDKHGEFASLEAKSAAIPYGALLSSSDGVAARLMNVVVSATLTVPTRKLAELPDLLRPEGASGEVEGTIAIQGTCMKPNVDAHLTARSVKFDTSPLLTSLDAEVTAKYDGARGDVALDVRSGSGPLMHATAKASARVADFIAGSAGDKPWDASAEATLSRFPLESIAPLADRHLHGSVSGRFELTGLHKDARATADLDLDGLRVGKAHYGKGKMTAGFDGHTLSAKLRLDQQGGFASGEAKIGMLWGSNPAPAPDPAGSMQASLQAKHFSAAFLLPFVQTTMDEIDGTIDADAQLSSAAGKKPEMSGSVVFANGLVELVALGQELHAVNAKVTFTPDGVVKLESMSAQGIGGKVTASGTAHVDGTALVGAEATVNIAKKDAMPLDVQGANLGTVYGQFVLKAATSGDRKMMNLDMDVPSLHVLLPEASTHSVQDLDEAPSQDHVGVYASPGRFVVLPIDGDPAGVSKNVVTSTGASLAVAVHLGKDIEIRRGTDIRVTLEGTLNAKLGQKTDVTGQIRLLGGKLDVQGKSFEIETGTVTFVGDPSNPLIKVTAGWTAEDGTRVFADYVGPLKTGKVTLRSEPARPKNEIVALILFGTADGSQATPYATPQPDVGTRAGTTVGGFATAGLSKGLDKLTGMDITAKIDTSQQNPRPEVEVQIAKDISLQLAFVLGQPPPGTNPDTTYATIDWRFMRSWSLETTFGNLGSSIADVVWQHRY